MAGNITRSWWAFVLQGVLAVAIGIAAFVVPGPTLAAFLVVFAVYAVATGIFEIVGGLNMPMGPKWSLVVGGVVSIALGVLAVTQPQSTAVAVTILVAIWSIATGVATLGAAVMLRALGNTFFLGLSGLISVAFGVLLIASPNDGVLAVLWLIGFYAIFAGITVIAFGLRLRSAGNDLSKLESELTGSTSTTQSPAASH